MVYNLLRTTQGVSPNVPAAAVITTIAMFVFMYTLLGALYVYLLNDKIQHGPAEAEREPLPQPELDLSLALRQTLAGERGLADI